MSKIIGSNFIDVLIIKLFYCKKKTKKPQALRWIDEQLGN